MIRNLVSADKPVLETIQRESLSSPWPELLDTAVQTQDLLLDGPHCFVATPPASNTPVGYILAVEGHPDADQSADDHEQEETKQQCYVAEIAVAADHRREGYGSALLKTVGKRTDADELLLTARATADTPRAFYTANGFRVIDRLSAYYDSEDSTQDGLLFSKGV